MNSGEMIPDVALTAPDSDTFQLRDRTGAPLVIYFYPKDDTTGCTREAQDFTALAPRFAAAGAHVIGISKDSARSHAKFAAKYDLTIELATDTGDVAEAFGVWGEKQMYGRTYMGIERATFLFDAAGRLVREWRKVKVPRHAEAVLAAAEALADA